MAQKKVVEARGVFWDAVGMVAVADADDRLHPQALLLRNLLWEEKRQFITTDAVLIEVANTLSKVRLRRLAIALIDALILSATRGDLEIVHCSEEYVERGWQLYKQRPDKEWGLTDCISFVVMQERGIREAFTVDRHFEQAGFMRLLR